jgi:hypothetical protein
MERSESCMRDTDNWAPSRSFAICAWIAWEPGARCRMLREST